MRQNKTYLFRRIIEALIITLISSCSVYILVIADIIPSTRGGYIGGFGASALIFLILNYIVLYAHFWALRFNIIKYLAVNLSILGVMTALSLIGLEHFSSGVYTAFFGYTKPFRQMFDMTAFSSACVFWALYLILIIFVIIKILYFDWSYRQYLEELYDREFELETIDFMEDNTQ